MEFMLNIMTTMNNKMRNINQRPTAQAMTSVELMYKNEMKYRKGSVYSG